MTKPVRLFIASSSEGLAVAKVVRGLLLQELGTAGDIRLWTAAFEFSAAYIESLEKASQDADFAVLVLTPDDVTTSRDAEKPSPRDNVVFELGLFIGSLGRERCFLVHERGADLKLPSDLLGVKAATFDREGPPDLKSALAAECFLISERILALGSRPKHRAVANLFWLGHDLARAIRFAMFDPLNRDELEKEMRQAVHHLDEIGLVAPDARNLLLAAIKMYQANTHTSDDGREQFINTIARAKNELGGKLAALQPGFRAYPTIETVNRLNRQIQDA